MAELEGAFVAFEDCPVVASVVVLEVAFAAFEAAPVVLPAGHLEEVDLALLGIEEVALVEAFAADLVVASAVLQVDFWVAFV